MVAPVVDILPFAEGAGANVLDQADYAALGARSAGFGGGIAKSEEVNKVLRQSAFVATMIAQFIADAANVDVLDDGDLDTLGAHFVQALQTAGPSPTLARGSIAGLGLSNTASFVNTRVTIAVGSARDSTDTQDLGITSPLTKDLSAVWSAGNNFGGRDSAAAVALTGWYHVFLIWKAIDGTVDALFSTSATNPTLPTGYTKFRRVGAILTDGSGNIRPFVQFGRRFELAVRTVDFVVQSNGGGPFLRQLVGVPRGVKVRPIVVFQSNGTVDANPYHSGIFDPDKGVPPAFGGPTQWAQIRRVSVSAYPGTFGNFGYFFGDVVCDSNAQVYTFSSDPLDVIAIGCVGWWDDLGGFN